MCEKVAADKLCNFRVSHHQSVTRPDPAAQERERLLSTLKEEASIAKDKVKQLSQVYDLMLCSVTRCERIPSSDVS